MIYVGTQDHKLHAFRSSSGWHLWDTGGQIGGSILFSAAAVANGVVYVGAMDYKLYAFNAATGTKLWDSGSTIGDLIWSSPALANGVVYVSSQDGWLYALNASNGSLCWKGAVGTGSSSPAVADGSVYIGADARLYAFNLEAGYNGPALKARRAAAATPPDPAHLVPDYRLEVQD